MKKLTRALFWLSFVLPLDILHNIQGSTYFWTVARGWSWNKEENINDLIYFLSWDLSWLVTTYCFINIAHLLVHYFVHQRNNESKIFWFWILSVAIRGLAYGKLVDEFTHPCYWHVGEIVVDFLVVRWCYLKYSERREDIKCGRIFNYKINIK